MNKQPPYRQHLNFWQWYHSAKRRMQVDFGCSLLVALSLLASCAGTNNLPAEQITPAAPVTKQVPASPPTSTVSRGVIHHYEYVFPDGGMYRYDMDHGHALVKMVSLPTNAGVRGVAASPSTHMLYVSYGGDGGGN